jgi:hypothetical protein
MRIKLEDMEREFKFTRFALTGDDIADMKHLGYTDAQIREKSPEERRQHLEADIKCIAAGFTRLDTLMLSLEEKGDLVVAEQCAWELFNKECKEMGVGEHSCRNPFQGLVALACIRSQCSDLIDHKATEQKEVQP